MSHGPPQQPAFSIDTQQAARARIERLREFYATLFVLTPRIFVTHIIVATNIVLFVLMVLGEPQAIMTPTIDLLINWGANHGPYTLNGQPWRLFTCMFLHIGIVHLAINMWILWDIGRLMERVVGNVGFALLYIVSGLCGSLVSILWNPQVVSAGASGAVFGIFGGLLGFLVLGRGSMPTEVSNSFRSSAVTFVGFNLVFGFIVAGVDNAAHIGGLVGGCLCGLCLGQPLTLDAADYRWLRNILVVVLGGGITAAGLLFIPKPVAFMDVERALADYRKVKATTDEASIALRSKALADEISPAQFADAIENELLPPWREMRKRLEVPKKTPQRFQPLVDALVNFVRLQEEAWELQVLDNRDHTPARQSRFEEREREALAAFAELNRISAELAKRPK